MTDLSTDAVRLAISADVPIYDVMAHKTVSTHMDARRVVMRADQDTACGFAPRFTGQGGDTIRGATAITFSAKLLAGLKSGQEEYLGVVVDELGALEVQGSWAHRVGSRAVDLPVILNDQRVTLPAVYAQCDTAHIIAGVGQTPPPAVAPCEYFTLDDPQDPIVLIWRTMEPRLKKYDQATRTLIDVPFVNGAPQVDTTLLQVVKISYAAHDTSGADSTEQQMGQALGQHKKVIVYGIYFDYAKSDIKKESAPVLREIADLMQKNPGWTLAMNGYTDSLGGAAYNLDLSKRRAAAVKDSLVTAYHIAPSRLTTAGYGASSPVDSNSTLVGRARNRRVELIRP